MSKYRKIAAVVIILVTFFFIGKVLYQNWSMVPFKQLEFNIGFLAISYVFQFSFFVLGAVGWVLILRRLGIHLPLRRALQIMSAAKLGRYIPGKVWAFVGQVYLAKRDDIPAHTAMVSVLLSTILSVLSALVIFLVSLVSLADKRLPHQAYLALLLIPLCFIVLHPSIMSKIVNWVLKRVGRELITFDFDYARILRILGVYCLNWVAQGFCFFFLIRSFYPIPVSAYLPLVGINSLAWTIGFLSFIVPGGLGVREGIQSFFLKFFVPLPVGIIAALLYRIWAIIGMLIFFGIFAGGLKTAEAKESSQGGKKKFGEMFPKEAKF